MRLFTIVLMVLGLGLAGNANALSIGSRAGAWGTLFPSLTDDTIEIARNDEPSLDPAEWFEDFSLVATLDVVLEDSSFSRFFPFPLETHGRTLWRFELGVFGGGDHHPHFLDLVGTWDDRPRFGFHLGVLPAIPEPSTALLVGLGLVGLGARRRGVTLHDTRRGVSAR